MLAGQCDAGKALARKAYEATGHASADQVDGWVDAQVYGSCRGGASNDRDRFLTSLYVLTARPPNTSVADCKKAYETAKRVAPSLTPRSSSDMAHDSSVRLKQQAPGCFAQAGDCASAWRVAKEQADAAAKERGRAETDLGKRRSFLDSTKGRCVDKERGPLADSEVLFRSIGELDSASRETKPSAAWCTSRVEKARPALKRLLASGPRGEDFKHEPTHLAEKAGQCLALADDCATAWSTYSGLLAEFPTSTNEQLPELRTREPFRDKVKACTFKPQGRMAPRATAYWASGVLLDGSRHQGVDASVCQNAYDAAKRAAEQSGGDKSINSEWRAGTQRIAEYAARCFQKAGDCAAGWKVFKDAVPRFEWRPEADEAKLRTAFESAANACKGR